MAEKTINVRLKNRYDTEANWSSANPILLEGEIAISSDKNGKHKVGNGTSKWSELPYAKSELTKEDVTGALGYTPPTTNTTYTTGTASKAGITKLYQETGVHTDGTMTQVAITEALDDKANASHNHEASDINLPTGTNGVLYNNNGNIAVSAVTYTELSYLDGINANVQNQLNGKASSSHTHNYAGASTAGGSANSAVKLDTASAGSATQPVYFSGGKPVAGTYTLEKSVPSNAVFTDTKYSAFKGATTEAAGGTGLVPAPATGAANRYLRSDGTWQVPPDTNTTYTLGSFGITATAAELNYMDGVTSNVQTQLNGKAASSHTHNYAGSGSAGGSANSAVKLDSSAGSATQPVYFSGGKPVACTYTLGKSVPSNAVFTDTNTWIALKGATASTAGTAGYVPAPAAGKQNSFLRGDGTWATPPNTTYNVATTSANGLMSSGDKTKLDGIATGANKYTHPTGNGNNHIPSGGSSGQILRWSAAGTAVWGSDNNTTYGVFKAATSSAAGGTGLVPAPAAGKQGQYLRGDGQWATPTNTTYSVMGGATSSAAGKQGLVPAPAAGYNTRYLRGDGTWQTPPNTTYGTGNASKAGIVKLYTGTGSATDGSMTQSAITNALNGKAASSHSHAWTSITSRPDILNCMRMYGGTALDSKGTASDSNAQYKVISLSTATANASGFSKALTDLPKGKYSVMIRMKMSAISSSSNIIKIQCGDTSALKTFYVKPNMFTSANVYQTFGFTVEHTTTSFTAKLLIGTALASQTVTIDYLAIAPVFTSISSVA